MQDDAGRVDDSPQPGCDFPAQPRRDGCLALGAFRLTVPLGCDLRPDRLDNPCVSVLPDELGVSRLVDELAYPRQGLRPRKPGIPYGRHVPNEIRLAGLKNGNST